jgi:hypothetical protein
MDENSCQSNGCESFFESSCTLFRTTDQFNVTLSGAKSLGFARQVTQETHPFGAIRIHASVCYRDAKGVTRSWAHSD